jgi:2-keto-4-pentenoate hydratase/2-oxohepta-3-ene-1,7-dioic acid hydratase in catechol pathway
VKIVTFQVDGRVSIGVLAQGGIVDLRELLPSGSAQVMLEALIDGFAGLRKDIGALSEGAPPLPLATVKLQPSVPAPGKVLCVMRNRPALESTSQPYAYVKYAAGGVGPGQVLRLPPSEEGLRFEPEVAAVVRGPARNVPRDEWAQAVFGYTGFLDVVRSSSSSGFSPAGTDDWSKSWDTAWAVGPCVVTEDAVPEPGRALTLRVSTAAGCAEVADPGRPSLPEIVEFLSSVMTLHTGDLIACGGHEAAVATALPDSRAELNLPGIGALAVETRA